MSSTENPITCADVKFYGDFKTIKWPWYVRLALLFRPTHTIMDDEGVFGHKYKRLFGKTYITDHVSNYVTPAQYMQ